MKKFKHKNIIQIHDFMIEKTTSTCYIVMEKAEGKSL